MFHIDSYFHLNPYQHSYRSFHSLSHWKGASHPFSFSGITPPPPLIIRCFHLFVIYGWQLFLPHRLHLYFPSLLPLFSPLFVHPLFLSLSHLERIRSGARPKTNLERRCEGDVVVCVCALSKNGEPLVRLLVVPGPASASGNYRKYGYYSIFSHKFADIIYHLVMVGMEKENLEEH